MPISRLIRRLTAKKRLRRAAADVFGWDRLRPGQLEAMRHILVGRDVLVVAPTGAGKSAVYQVPSVLLPGPTVVVSPLLALQRDQVSGLRIRSGQSAVVVNSSRTESQNAEAFAAVRAGAAKFLFLAPEQLIKQDVRDELAAARPSLFVVDEAHCISSWGHDFRPDYLRLHEAIEALGHPTVIALTATAAPPVREDILAHLGLRHAVQVVSGFARPNLRLEVRRHTSDADKRAAVLDRAVAESKPGLVYTATRKEAERFAADLRGRGVNAATYHAGMTAGARHDVHEGFLGDEIDVVVATSAFGMGIDKPNVRFVLHAAISESVDAYYQEIGRAGRDGAPALAVLFYRTEDLGLRQFFGMSGPDTEALTVVVKALRGRQRPPTRTALGTELGLSAQRLTKALNLLEQTGTVEGRGRAGLRYVGGPAEDAVAKACELAENRRKVDQSRLEMMRGYAETTGCRRQFVLAYFGEHLPAPCRQCDGCDAGNGRTSSANTYAVNARVRHVEWGDGVVMREEPDRVTVLFTDVGYRTLSLAAVAEQNLLAVIRDR